MRAAIGCILVLNLGMSFAQVGCTNATFEDKVDSYITRSVPVMDVSELQSSQSEYVILDAREKEEFDISHIPSAQYTGYDKFNIESLKDIPKDADIVVYCSIGYRSEKIGEKLQDMGYTSVKNLYGGIFEWTNRRLPVEDSTGAEVERVHAYSRGWSKWLSNEDVEKVW